jgi:DnaJ-class molecular chaperone
MTKRDYYEILGVDKSANDNDIKKAYRSLASKTHPDKGGDTAKFQEIQEAYAALSDPQKREAYNMYGHDAQQRTNGPQWSHNSGAGLSPDQLKEMFGGMFGAGHPFGDIFGNSQQRQRHVINITLEDAYTGKQLRLPSGVALNIPPGIRSGTKFHHDNVIYEVHVQPHTKFKRAGDDLLVDVEISAIEAMLSVDATLDHLDSSQLQFTIPSGIQNGQVVRLARKGIKNPETDRFGDLMVRITVTTPKSLTDEQIAFLKTMQHRKSFNI